MVIDDIKRMRWEHLRHGEEPKKITMNQRTFDEIVSSSNELICIDAGDHPEYKICGMDVEIRNDVDPTTMFIIS